MNNQQKPLHSPFFHLIATVLLGLVEGVPFSIGILLRKLVYRIIFGHVGKGVQIQRWVELDCTTHVEIGNGTKIGRDVRVKSLDKNTKISIGQESQLDRGVDIKIHPEGDIQIGDRTYVGPYTSISGRQIKIGNNCLIASHSGIYANNHNFDDPLKDIRKQGLNYKQIVIEDNCWLGTGVKVLDGVTIGHGSVIGAGAVVTKDIPPLSVAVGVPAKVIAKRDTIRDNESIESQVLQLVESANSN